MKKNPSEVCGGSPSANKFACDHANTIIFTDAAKQHIQNMLQNKGKHAALRLSLKKAGCSGYSYVPEVVTEKKSSDLEIKETDFPIYLDSETASLMQGTHVDYVKKNLGVSQLEFKHPRAKNMCGCGESFTIE